MNSIAFSDIHSQRYIAEQRVTKIAGYLRIGTGCLLLLTLLWLIFILVWAVWTPTTNHDAGLLQQLITDGKLNVTLSFSDTEMTMKAKLLISAIGLSIALFSMYFLSRLHALFGNFRRKRIFTKRNSQLIRHIGYALVAALVFEKILNIAVLVALGLFTDSGWWVLSSQEYTLGVSTIFFLIIIGLVFLTAWILDIGRDLYVDAELTI